MRATIDAGGRVVVPKAIRERLGLTPGAEVELVERDSSLEITAVPTEMRLVTEDDVVVAHADRAMPVLTSEAVRSAVEHARR